ncbi:MAG TPA: TRAP transporter small permease [Dehalococcoidales bacterium]|nr:TRAP transporter small permease [Dehalococcoidales bacterium]
MDYFVKIMRRAGGVGAFLSGAFLTGMMLLIMANVIIRLFGGVVLGSYELTELMVVVVVSFALVYAMLEKGHVVVNILVDRFPRRVRLAFEALTHAISLGIWAVIAWASYNVLVERWLKEQSEMLSVPYSPFRLVFLLGVIFLCLVLLTGALVAAIKAVKK